MSRERRTSSSDEQHCSLTSRERRTSSSDVEDDINNVKEVFKVLVKDQAVVRVGPRLGTLTNSQKNSQMEI